MTKYFEIRDTNGKLISKCTFNSASRCIQEIDGFWRVYKTADYETQAYEVTDDSKIMIKDFTLYVWEGYLFIVRTEDEKTNPPAKQSWLKRFIQTV